MKKKPKTNNFVSPEYIELLIEKWRNILGIDPVYEIQFIESPEDNGYPAWIDGLDTNNTHPTANIFINAAWLQKNKNDENKIVGIIVHELLHIILFESFVMIDPTYTYVGIKARANEILTMKLTNAIMKIHTEH